MNKIIISFILILMFIPLCYAQDYQGVQYETTRIWADATNNPNSTAGNISIIYPNGTYLINRTALTHLQSNIYYYDVVLNSTGNYLFQINWTKNNGTVQTDYHFGTVFVEENPMPSLTILFGLLALIVLCFWYARSMANKPITSVNLWIVENVTTKDFSIIFDIVGGFLVIPLLAFLNIIATGSTYAPMFEKLYIVGTYFIGFTLLAYLIFYLMYRYNEGLETLGDIGSGKKR